MASKGLYLFWIALCTLGSFFLLENNSYLSALLVATAIYLLLRYHQYNPISVYKAKRIALKRLVKIQQAPLLIPELIDSYVQLSATIASSNKEKVPDFKKACVFYIYKVSAHWKTRATKPSKGTDSHKKILFEKESSSPVIKLNHQGQNVMVNLDLYKPLINRRLRVESKDSYICPDISKNKDLAKYEKYTSDIRYCKFGDEVIVMGRLTDRNGLLEIIPAVHSNLPAFFCVGTMDDISKHYKDVVNRQYKMTSGLRISIILLSVYLLFILLSTGDFSISL